VAEQLTRLPRRSEAGAELVEFAMIVPLLLIVVTGIVDFAFLLRSYEVATNAAREGARVAVLPGYGASTATTRVAQYITAAGGETDALHLETTVTPVAISMAPGFSGGNGVRVTVEYTHEFLFLGWILGLIDGTFDSSVTFTTSADMRSEIQSVIAP
jgi:Flp pilus assembly protein TadG